MMENENDKKQRIAKQLNQVICICKGIKLSSVLKALKSSTTVEQVNRKCGSGDGGCQGERCGPKIKALVEKKKKSSG